MMREFTPESHDEAAFREALGCFPTGVTVITAQSVHGPIGITANSFSSLSLDPPMILWAPARASRRFAIFAEAPFFAVHVLGTEHHGVGRRFSKAGHDFTGCAWRESAEGVPLLEDCIARFDCARAATHDAGDHAIVIGRVLRAAVQEGAPLIFARGEYGGFTAG